MCFSTTQTGTSPICMNYPHDDSYVSHPSFQFWNPKYRAKGPNSKILQLYYYWRSNLQKPVSEIEDFDNFKFYVQDLGEGDIEFDSYSIALQNYKSGEPSVMDATSLDWFLKTTFSGKIQAPEFGTLE